MYNISFTSSYPGPTVYTRSPYNFTHSPYSLILSPAHRDWQRSPHNGAVAAAFTKLNWMNVYTIKI